MAANGWTPDPVQLQALPVGGGLQATATAAAAPMNMKWGSLTLDNLAPGQYMVFALMTLNKEGQQPNTVCSAVSSVTVIDKGGAPPVPVGTVSYANGDPKFLDGSVSVSNMGTYTINTEGYEASACGLAVIPYGGGEMLTAYAKSGPDPLGGNWGPITISTLPSGQFLVVGSVTMETETDSQSIKTSIKLF